MGSGASTQQSEQLQKDLERHKQLIREKELEVEKLQKQLGAIKRQSVLAAGAASGESKAPTKQRRIEVSAEIFAAPQEADEIEKNYTRKVIPKEEAVKTLLSAVVSENILFRDLSQEERDECVDGFERVTVASGQKIIAQGAKGDDFYVVQTGSFDILVQQGADGPEVNYGQVAAGRSFGELALMYNTPRAASIKAKEDAVLWSLNRATYKSIAIHHRMLAAKKHEATLRTVPILQCLSTHELRRMAGAMEEEAYEAGDVIIRQGEDGDHFYILKTGEVSISIAGAEEEAGRISAGGYFGEKALLTEEKRAATITAQCACTVLSMNRSNFQSMLGTLQELIDREAGAGAAAAGGGGEGGGGAGVSLETHQYHVDIGWEQLDILATLGEGAFGRVKLVRRKGSEETYALKCMAKQSIVDSNLQDHVVNEKNVMLALNHPFILRLHNTYKDGRFIYLLIELAQGGEMFTCLRNVGRFSEKASKFYAASVLLAFEHMHNKNIIYRDLKPENLLLDSGGFLKVADFGLAKVCADRTYTLCGTPDYLAPEIILSKGHGKAVDYWALGVLIYEMATGVVPFYSDDPMEVYQLILQHDLRFPKFLSRSCRDLVGKLLEENPAQRLGNLKDGTKDIVKARWFSGFDWSSLLARQMRPPMIPKVTTSTDTSNFDFIDEGEQTAPPCNWDPDF